MVKNHELFWYVSGIRVVNPTWSPFRRILYRCYQGLLHTFITFYYPGSLIINILLLNNRLEILENVTIALTLCMCSVKLYLFSSNMEGFKQCALISQKMDENAKADPDEISMLLAIKKKTKFLLAPYFFTYTATMIAALLLLFFNSEKRLVYPAYFPFDWKKSDSIYIATILYQYVGILIQCYGSLVNDTYIPLLMCLLTRHMKVLSERVSKIGTNDKKSQSDHHEDLRAAIRDHKELIK